MNEEEKYLFDLRGYLVVKNALTEKQVRNLSKILDEKMQFLRKTGAASDTERNLGGSDRTQFLTDDDIATDTEPLTGGYFYITATNAASTDTITLTSADGTTNL